MWIVDSSVWIDYFRGTTTPQTERLDAGLGRQEIGLGDIILAEVLQGFRSQRDFETARDALLRFPIFLMGGIRVAVKSAENLRLLRQLGITPRKTVDCLIATFVIENGFTLLHADRDFDAFEEHLGLSVVH